MLGTLLNVAAITAGCAVGLASGARIPERSRDTILGALGAVTLVYGVSMGLKTANILVPLSGLVLGTAAGEALRLSDRLEALGERLKARFAGSGGENVAAGSSAHKTRKYFVDGFVAASILFCVGPMTVLGSVEDGLGMGIRMLAIKSLLDCVASAAFSAGMGIGVWFSVITVLVVQGGITLFASSIAPYLTPPVVAELSACGGFMLIVIGLGLLGAVKVKATNMLPGIVITPLLVLVLNHFGIGWQI